MNLAAVEKVADAVLYEGYVLYPYRASAAKNRQRWNFGGLFPKAYSEAQRGSDAWTMQTECLVEGDAPTVDIKVRFLQVTIREAGRLTSRRARMRQSAASRNTKSSIRSSSTARRFTPGKKRSSAMLLLQGLSLAEIAAAGVIREFSFPADRKLEIASRRDQSCRHRPSARANRRKRRDLGRIGARTVCSACA